MRIAAALFAFLLLAGCGRSSFHMTDITGAMPRLDFRMTRVADGKTVTGADYRGKVVALYFGYTNCPDVCPTTLTDLSRLLDQVKSPEVRVLFVSVDHASFPTGSGAGRWCASARSVVPACGDGIALDQLGHLGADHVRAEQLAGLGVEHGLDQALGSPSAIALPLPMNGKCADLDLAAGGLGRASVRPTLATCGAQ
jgi:hypothetical protein